MLKKNMEMYLFNIFTRILKIYILFLRTDSSVKIRLSLSQWGIGVYIKDKLHINN
jgi:hypothetical protein